jgi:hypothetical protein
MAMMMDAIMHIMVLTTVIMITNFMSEADLAVKMTLRHAMAPGGKASARQACCCGNLVRLFGRSDMWWGRTCSGLFCMSAP